MKGNFAEARSTLKLGSTAGSKEQAARLIGRMRRMAIPVTRSRVFSTSRDNRGEVRIRIVQGESLKAEENIPLGELVISGLRPSSGSEARVLVTFEVDESGILNVTAKESETGRTCKRSVRVSGELDSEGIARIELV